jgi:hypothetical protein
MVFWPEPAFCAALTQAKSLGGPLSVSQCQDGVLLATKNVHADLRGERIDTVEP